MPSFFVTTDGLHTLGRGQDGISWESLDLCHEVGVSGVFVASFYTFAEQLALSTNANLLLPGRLQWVKVSHDAFAHLSVNIHCMEMSLQLECSPCPHWEVYDGSLLSTFQRRHGHHAVKHFTGNI